MDVNQILKSLFPKGLEYKIEEFVVTGQVLTELGEIKIIGTVDSAAINQRIAIKLSHEILNVIQKNQKTPVLFIVDTQGQDLSRADEVLCLNKTFAHLASCVDLLRRAQHPNCAIVLGQAVSGGFLSYGLMANEVYALADSQVKVMDLNAMARVTKIPVERLQALSKSSAVFAPGVENFYKMGAIHEVWHHLNEELINNVFKAQMKNIESFIIDRRKEIAFDRQGRLLCNDVIEKVLLA